MSSWDIVKEFERKVAEYAGATYGVATDTGTAAIHLCCEYFQVQRVTIPKRTYLSVPNCIIHAGGSVEWSDEEWVGDYRLHPYPIVDSACRFTKDMHSTGEYRCLSFQARKILAIGRGGMILHDDPVADEWFRKARFSGRNPVPLMQDKPKMLGWHYFMEPERAAKGLWLMEILLDGREHIPDAKFQYPDLSELDVFKE